MEIGIAGSERIGSHGRKGANKTWGALGNNCIYVGIFIKVTYTRCPISHVTLTCAFEHEACVSLSTAVANHRSLYHRLACMAVPATTKRVGSSSSPCAESDSKQKLARYLGSLLEVGNVRNKSIGYMQ